MQLILSGRAGADFLGARASRPHVRVRRDIGGKVRADAPLLAAFSAAETYGRDAHAPRKPAPPACAVAMGVRLPDYSALHAWWTAHCGPFWLALWDFCGAIAERRGERALGDGDAMPGARWFPDARLNCAENLLRGVGDGQPTTDAGVPDHEG